MTDKIEQKVIEILADIEHQRRSDWQKYMFSKCEQNKKGELIIPVWAVSRWGTQMEIDYKDLSEEEKESDRKEINRYLPIILKEIKQEYKQEVKKMIEELRREEGQDIITATDIKLESFKEGSNQTIEKILKKLENL